MKQQTAEKINDQYQAGLANLMNVIDNELQDIALRTKWAIAEAINQRINAIDKIIKSEEAHRTFNHATGTRFDKMYELRKRLRLKMFALDEAALIAYSMDIQ